MDEKKILERKIDDLYLEISSLRRENDSLRAQNQMMEKIIVQNLSDRSNGGWHITSVPKIKEDPYNYNKEEKKPVKEQKVPDPYKPNPIGRRRSQDKKKTCLSCCMYELCKKWGQVSMNMVHTSLGERFIGRCDKWSDNILDWAKKARKDNSQVDIQTDEYGLTITYKGPMPERRV